MLARPRQHDRREPAADRHRLDDGRVHRLLAPALEGRDRLAKHREVGGRRARSRALDRDRLPGRRHDLLADAAAEALDHPVRLRDPGRRSSCSTRCGSRARPPRSPTSSGPPATWARSRPSPRRTTVDRDRGVRRRGDPAVRRTLRRGAGRERRGARRERVPAGAVDRAARLRGARAARGGPVRLAAQHERRSRHARVVEGEPVDAAGRHAADRVRGRGRRTARSAARHACSARSCSSRRRSRSSPWR